MKKIFISAMILLPCAVLAQKPFIIRGDIKSLKTGDKVYLVYNSIGKLVTDSAIVANGIFELKGVIKDPVKGDLFLNKNPYTISPVNGEILDRLSLYLEPATIKITAPDSLKKASISGSVINDEDKKLKTLINPIEIQLIAIRNESEKLPDAEKNDPIVIGEIRTRFNKVAEELKPILLNFVKNNPKSYISLGVVSQLASDPAQVIEAEKAYAGLSQELKATKAGVGLFQALNAGKKTTIGVQAIDFTQNDVNGKPVKLSNFRGKYVLLDFWASWCGPCREENPNVVKAYNTYKDKNFTVIGVSLDKPGKKADWLKAIQEDGLTWTHVSDLKWWDNAVSKMYGIRGIPANFLIDPEGKIIAKDIRGQELQKKLSEVLSGGQSK